jgi:TolA-binding protein
VPASLPWQGAEKAAQRRWAASVGQRKIVRAEPAVEPPKAEVPSSVAPPPEPEHQAPPPTVTPSIPEATHAAPRPAPTEPAVALEKVSPDHAREIALYKTALEALRAGRASEAADRFTWYLDRYPQGSLRTEAELSRLEALHSAGDRPRLERAVDAWLASHPNDPRSSEVRGLLSDRP